MSKRGISLWRAVATSTVEKHCGGGVIGGQKEEEERKLKGGWPEGRLQRKSVGGKEPCVMAMARSWP
jgi:hypothetical protein